MVLEDAAPASPRGFGCLGKLVCLNDAAHIGDPHNHADSETFLRALVNQTVTPDEVLQFVAAGKSDTLRLQRQDSGVWGLLSPDKASGSWAALMYFDKPPMENAAKAKTGILDEMGARDLLRLAGEHNLILPVYLNEGVKEGVATSPSSGSSPVKVWDDGQIGWVYVSHEDILREFGEASLSPETLDDAESLLRGEINVYDCYLRGECYRFVLLNGTDTVIRQNGLIGTIDDIKADLADILPEECRGMAYMLEYVDETAANGVNGTDLFSDGADRRANSVLPDYSPGAPSLVHSPDSSSADHFPDNPLTDRSLDSSLTDNGNIPLLDEQEIDTSHEADNSHLISIESAVVPSGGRSGGILGTASVTVGGLIIIRGLKIERGQKGVSVLMPQSKDGEGNTYEICAPLTKELRERIAKAVIEGYNNEIEKQRNKVKKPLNEPERA